MLLVINKEKINAYLLSIGTVTLLFIMGFFIASRETVQTMANEYESINQIEFKTKENNENQKNNQIDNA